VKEICLSDSCLEEIPKELSWIPFPFLSFYQILEHLSTLILATFANLQKLDLSFNAITHLPDFFTQLENLESLNLRGNPIDSMNKNLEEICLKLPRLKFLEVPSMASISPALTERLQARNGGVNISSEDPHLISRFSGFKIVDSVDSQMYDKKELSTEVEEPADDTTLADLRSLKTLTISKHNTYRLDEVCEKATNLSSLAIRDCSLTSIPSLGIPFLLLLFFRI